MAKQSVEYVAHVDTAAGPRGTVLSADQWADLSNSARDDFVRRELADLVKEQ